MQGISVIICCYNSASRLPHTLDYLSKQVVKPGINWEIIIVDNNSKDATAKIANEFARTFTGAPCIVVEELNPGLSHARQKGIDQSRYDYLLFCDDDNWLDPAYIRTAYQVMMEHPAVAALGGHGEPVCEIEPPDWFERFKGYYATGPQGERSGDITSGKGYVFGAGSIYRKAVLEFLFSNGFRNLLEDRKGNSLTSGGDVEICKAFKLAGYKIWYDERLKFSHFIPRERLTWNYIVKLHQGYVESFSILYSYNLIERSIEQPSRPWRKDVLVYLYIFIKHVLRFRKYNKMTFPIYKLFFHYRLQLVTTLLMRKRILKNVQQITESKWFKEKNPELQQL